MSGINTGSELIEGGASGFFLGASPGQFASGIPEYIPVWLSNAYGSALTHAVNLYLNGVEIDSVPYGYNNGWHGIWVDSPTGTVITLDAWTDQDGSLHLDFHIDHEPE
jgi:hypothetical protein